MSGLMRWRRRRWWMLAACTGVLLATCAGLTASADPGASCDQRVNDTADKLVECVTSDDLWNHMKSFQTIAEANPSPADGHPSRNSGEPGYKASADYVAKTMTDAGYEVTIQTYKFTYYAYRSEPVMKQLGPTGHEFALGPDWNPGQSTGMTSAELEPAGHVVIPPTPTPTSASGCAASDFAGFSTGRIALIQRGSCTVGTKVQNAQNAGASGVIIFNEGNPGRTDPFAAGLTDAAGKAIIPRIPVAFTSFAVGQGLYNEYQQAVRAHAAAPSMDLVIDAVVNPNAEDYNVIADSAEGDPNHVLVVDAHLDAIYGAGMLDNASGSATILDIAQQMKRVKPRNKLRFIWFGGEELGLLGSSFYLNNLAPAELSRIGYDLDADVTATPNYIIGVLDPAAPDFSTGSASTTFPPQVYQPSTVARDQAIRYFDSVGLHHKLFSPAGTDAFNFNLVGIPASGLLTGQDCCKNQDDVNLFGGSLGNFEGHLPSTDGGCVDIPLRWCDNLSNNDPKVLTFISKGFATMVVRMAFEALPPGGHKP
jgi:Zn-dependent M28 family amino/carboxypeptidase